MNGDEYTNEKVNLPAIQRVDMSTHVLTAGQGGVFKHVHRGRRSLVFFQSSETCHTIDQGT